MNSILKTIVSKTIDNSLLESIFDSLTDVENKKYFNENENKVIEYLKTSFYNTRELPTTEYLMLEFPEYREPLSTGKIIPKSDIAFYLKNFYKSRSNKLIAQEILKMGTKVQKDGFTYEDLDKLRSFVPKDDVLDIKDTLETAESFIEFYEQKKQKPIGLSTCIKEIDDRIGGLSSGTVTTIAGFTSHYKCVASHTLLLTNKGVQKAVSTYLDPEITHIYSATGFEKINKKIHNGRYKGYTVATFNGSTIDVSKKHPFLVYNPQKETVKFVKAKNLKKGDLIIRVVPVLEDKSTFERLPQLVVQFMYLLYGFYNKQSMAYEIHLPEHVINTEINNVTIGQWILTGGFRLKDKKFGKQIYQTFIDSYNLSFVEQSLINYTPSDRTMLIHIFNRIQLKLEDMFTVDYCIPESKIRFLETLFLYNTEYNVSFKYSKNPSKIIYSCEKYLHYHSTTIEKLVNQLYPNQQAYYVPEMVFAVVKNRNEDDYFDFTVDNSHTYLANGFLTHNTTIGVNIAYKNAKKNKYNIVYISLEVAKEDMMMNLLCRHSFESKFDKYSFIKHADMRYLKLTDDQYEYLKNEVIPDFYSTGGQLKILDETDFRTFSFSEIREKLYEVDDEFMEKTGYGIDAIIWDHAQLFKFNQSGSQKRSEMSEGNEYVSFIRKLGIAFRKDPKDNTMRKITNIILSQTNREGWQKAMKNKGRYQISALSEINELERASQIVFFSYVDDNLKSSKEALITLAKNRNGETLYDPVSVYVDPEAYVVGDDIDGFSTQLSMTEVGDIFGSGDDLGSILGF